MKKKDKEKYFANGQLIFVQTKDGLKECRYDRNYYIDEFKDKLGLNVANYVDFIYDSKFTFTTYNLMTGKKFLKMVLSGYFTNDDGCVSEVFADGFKTNLGLFTDNLISGEGCLLDEDAWKDMCNRYNIEVNWANK